MVVCVRNADWEDDKELKDHLEEYVCHSFRQQEILDFMNAEFPMYAWSKGTLSRHLQFFGIKYVDYGTSVDAKVCQSQESC